MKRLLLLLALAFASPAMAASPGTPVTHAELDGLIHQYLVDHPEAVLDAIGAMQKRELEQSQAKAAAAMKTNHASLFEDKDTPAGGDLAHPEITIVEFFDYNCGVCKSMFPSIERVANDKSNHVRLLFKELPIFGPASEAIAKIALAVNRDAPEKYFAFHAGVMKMPGHPDTAGMQNLLTSIGLDPAKIAKLAQDPSIQAALDKNHSLGEQLGIRGTPTFLIGDEMIPHAMEYDDFMARIVAQKQKQHTK